MNCSDFQDRMQHLLDQRCLQTDVLLDQHLDSCTACAQLYRTAQRMQRALDLSVRPASPPDLGARVVGLVLKEQRERRSIRPRIVPASLAAGILAAVLSGSLWLLYPPAALTPEPISTAPRLSLRKEITEAGQALSVLAGRTAAETVGPVKLLIPDPSAAAQLLEPIDLGPPTQTLRDTGQGLSRGLEPVTDSARRGVQFFLRAMSVAETESN